MATSTNKEDQIFEEYAKKYKLHFFTGSENNVLNRFIKAAHKYELDSVVRICSDNPFFDVDSLHQLIGIYKNTLDLDYCSYQNSSGVPVIKTHLGLSGEVISLKALQKVQELTDENQYIEHVTNYIYSHSDLFNIHLENLKPVVFDRNDLRFTIDDIKDFKNLSFIYEQLSKRNKTGTDELVDFVDKNVATKIKMKANINKYTK